MKKQLASFRDFLATGTLGALSPGMKLIDVAELLGPPDGWNIDEPDPVPLYWFFGKLEISFESVAPYQMNWFQIEGAAHLKGKLEPPPPRRCLGYSIGARSRVGAIWTHSDNSHIHERKRGPRAPLTH
jgi:hypothetical protein